MAYLDPGNQDFSNQTRRTYHSRGRDLRSVDTALATAQRTPSNQNLILLLRALQHWHDQNRKEFMVRGQATGAYSQLWAEIEGRLGHRHNYWGNASSDSWNKSPFIWVSERKENLDRMKNYASMDMRAYSHAVTPCCRKQIVWRDRDKAAGTFTCSTCNKTHPEAAADLDWTMGFAKCVKEAKRKEVHDRFREADARGVDISIAPPRPSEWDAGTAKTYYDLVKQKRAGICTLFAYAAAHILTHNRPRGPLVEVVGYNNHVYVVVGRKGRAVNPGEKLPNRWHWGSSYVIVDGWAGAMGYDVVYKQTTGFPYRGMMKNLTLLMKREASVTGCGCFSALW